MAVHNEEVASAFDEIGDLLAIQGANAFRTRAYRRAAQVIRGLPRELSEMRGEQEWRALPGVGRELGTKIAEMLASGKLRALEKLRRQVPKGVRELLKLPGLGPARVRALFTGLKVRGIKDLRRALATGRLGKVRGFGPGVRARLAAVLSEQTSGPADRVPRHLAAQYAQPLQAFLESLAGVSRVDIAGSYRRGRDTVGDLDALVCAPANAKPLRSLERYADLRTITAAGNTKAAGVLRNGLQVDFRVIQPDSYGAALLYFTGSRDHSIHLRRRAQARGCRLSEYGLFRGDKRLAGRTEEQVYEALGLSWIPPELREDRGEIEAAERGALPRLVAREDLRGDLHVHTSASGGTESIRKMVAAARARRLDYVAITDHSKSVGVTHGLDAGRLARQIDAIDAMNGAHSGVRVLKGAEVDILEDGKLALPDSMLRRLDVVVIAVHTHFDLPEAKQTARILRALERPYISILAHPTGRLLGERPANALDFERLLTGVQERGCFLELNAQPLRLDLDDIHAKAARDRKILLSIASDAHAATEIDYLEDGVRQARRAWLTKTDVLNTRPLRELRSLLRGAMR